MEISLDRLWNEYGMDELQASLDGLFPQEQFDLEGLFSRILSGDILGGIREAFYAVINGASEAFVSMKEIFVWILVLGIAAALVSHFIEIFDNHEVADIGFYFTYLLMTAILLRCFLGAAEVATETIQKIVTFIQLFIPAYFLSVGVSAGSITATSGYQITLLLIYLAEHVLLTLIIPFIHSYVLLSVINGLWSEERLGLLVEGVEKGIRFLLKASLSLVTGLSAFQSMITPAIDSVKKAAFQKTVSAIPGVGDAADGVMEVVLGSAVVIKNSIGVVMLILLVAISAVPLLEILITAVLIKVAAALLGIVSDKRVTACTDKVGNGSQLLFRTAGTSVLLFMITISVAAYTTNRGF